MIRERKIVSGIKPHIIAGTQEFPHAMAITIANINDRANALKALNSNQSGLSKVESVRIDGSHTR